MSFADELRAFAQKLPAKTNAVVVGTAAEVHRSVQVGSELTGAPGQPVDTGNLRASWQLAFPTPETADITTNVAYAPSIEEGARDGRALALRSEVGGFHSVALTIAGFDRIVEHETARLTGTAIGGGRP